MISIEQLRVLQKKIAVLVHKYQNLVEENTLLKTKLRNYEQRVSELESHYSHIQEDQEEMERTILTALNELDKIEGNVAHDTGQDADADTTESFTH